MAPGPLAAQTFLDRINISRVKIIHVLKNTNFFHKVEKVKS